MISTILYDDYSTYLCTDGNYTEFDETNNKDFIVIFPIVLWQTTDGFYERKRAAKIISHNSINVKVFQ